jgi:hypothetical protein
MGVDTELVLADEAEWCLIPCICKLGVRLWVQSVSRSNSSGGRGLLYMLICPSADILQGLLVFRLDGLGLRDAGFAYQIREVANMTNENERAVSSRVDIGRPVLTRWISVTKNQKAWKTVMMLHYGKSDDATVEYVLICTVKEYPGYFARQWTSAPYRESQHACARLGSATVWRRLENRPGSRDW